MATIKVKAAPEVGNEFVPFRTVPSVRFPNTAAPLGKALQGLGQAFIKAQAAGLAAEEAKWDVEYYKLKQDLEHNLREMARQAPADGKAFSETFGNYFLERTNRFLESVPEPLRRKYATRLARDQLDLERRTYNFEVQLHDEALKRNIEDMVKTGESAVIGNPSKHKATIKAIEQSIDQMALPASAKEDLKRRARERIETAAFRSDATGAYLEVWLDKLGKAEGYGKSKTSSAAWHFGFIKDTWLNLVKKYAPDVYRTYDKATILAMRKNYAFARQMARFYLLELITNLHRHNIPVNETTVRLSWHFGPEGAVRIWNAPRDAHITAVLTPGELRANKYLLELKDQTVAGLLAEMKRQMGGKVTDPYPNVPATTKVSLLLQAGERWRTLAAGDLNTISAQFNNIFSTIEEKVSSMEPEAAVQHLTDLLSSGRLDRVVASKVERLLEKVEKKRWAAVERDAVLGVWEGRYGPEIVDKLSKQGAPLSVLRSVRRALKSRGAKQVDPQIAKWETKIALGELSEETIIEIENEIRNNPQRAEELRKVLSRAKKALKEAQEEDFKRLFDQAATGGLTMRDLEGMLDRLTPQQYKTLRAEIERREKLRAKLTEEEQAAIDDEIGKRLMTGELTPEAAVREAVSRGLDDTVARRRKYLELYRVWEKKQEGLRSIELLNAKWQAGMPIDPDADKKALEDWYIASEGPQHIQLGDEEWVYQNLLPLAERGAIPPSAAKHISGLLLSDNQEAFWKGVRMMTMIAERNPQVLNRQFGEDAVKDWQIAGVMVMYGLDRQTAFDRIRAIREARMTGNLKPLEAEAEEHVKDIDAEAVIDLLDMGGELDKQVAAAQNGPLLLSSYKQLFKLYYPYFGDKERTDQAVAQALTRTWGTWESKHNEPGSLWGHVTRFMLLPPNLVYSRGPDGTHKWIDDWLDSILEKYREQYDGQRIVLLADRTSIEEFRMRKPVTYRGYIVSRTGNVYPLPDRLKPPGMPAKEAAKEFAKEWLRRNKDRDEALYGRMFSPLGLWKLLTEPTDEMREAVREFENAARKKR